MTTRLLIFGTGALAREVVEVVARVKAVGADLALVGFLVDDDSDSPPVFLGLPVGRGLALSRGVEDLEVVIAVGDPAAKARIARRLEVAGFRFHTLVDPHVSLGPSSVLGAGTIAFGHSSVTANCTVGQHVLINPGCTIAHDNSIGDFSTLSPGVDLAGYVRLGSGVFVGTGACFIPRVVVGDDAVVGAGAVVIRDVGAATTVVGNPARVLR